MEGLKISTAAVREAGSTVAGSAGEIIQKLDELYKTLAALGGSWRDESYSIVAEKLNKEKTNLENFANELAKLGNDLISAADTYAANKAKIDSMLRG